MSREQEIIAILEKKFPFLVGKLSAQREKRIISESLTVKEFVKILKFVHDELGFYRASHVVGTDDGDTFGLLYILADEDSMLLILRESVPRDNPRADSISAMYPSVVLHERELIDLFGIQISGMPDGPNYPLPDGWPEGSYPLRKDWNPALLNKDTLVYEKPANEEVEG